MYNPHTKSTVTGKMASITLKMFNLTASSAYARRGGQRLAHSVNVSRCCTTQTFSGSMGYSFRKGKQARGKQFLFQAIVNRAVRSQWMALRSLTLGGEQENALVDISQILVPSEEIDDAETPSLFGDESALVLSSTMKKRAMKMNKHKLKKRRKALRMNTKRSRG